jgi:hypothetical protein
MEDRLTATVSTCFAVIARDASSRVHRNGPVRFTAITASQWAFESTLSSPVSRSGFTSSPSRVIPALLTSTFTGPPSAAAAASNNRTTSSSRDTSAAIPGASRAPEASATAAGSTSQNSTRAPLSRRRFTKWNPIPRAPPVTTARTSPMFMASPR